MDNAQDKLRPGPSLEASPRATTETIADIYSFGQTSVSVPVGSSENKLNDQRRLMCQKLLSRGEDAMADDELLELLLSLAGLRTDTKLLAEYLIDHFGSFGYVLAASPRRLSNVRGVEEEAAAAIRLVQAAAIRLARADIQSAPIMSNWKALIAYLNIVQGRENVEQFRVLFLDNRNRLIADETQGLGTVNHTPVYRREIVRRALELYATALILVHNHPSGDTTPSREDIERTRTIIEALRSVEIVVHDHIIVGRGNWLSFQREGLLN